MSKNTLHKEIVKELEKLNDTIDRKIIKGLPFQKEARRHKELLATLRRMNEDETFVTHRRSRIGKSPVRRSLSRGVMSRIFCWNMAC